MRVAVWGIGRHAVNKILPAVSAVSGLVLYGVCARNAKSVFTCSEMWKCKGWTEAASMLCDASVDIVYVATPIGLHAEHGKRVLEARKHLWCEKPLTGHLPDPGRHRRGGLDDYARCARGKTHFGSIATDNDRKLVRPEDKAQ